MIERLKFELAALINQQIDAGQAGHWQTYHALGKQAAQKREEIAKAEAHINTLVSQLWPGARAI